MDDERFVLADLYQSRLLVYSGSEGLQRVVNGWENEDLELHFVSPADIQPWEDGYVLAEVFTDQDRLLELNADLRPVRVFWESDVERSNGEWEGDDVHDIDQLAALRDTLYVQAHRMAAGQYGEREYAEFGVALQPNRPGRALREVAAWPALARQREWYGSLSDLATTGGRGGSAFALEITPAASFVQELVADGRRLESFPELPAPLPALPRDDFAEFYAVLEASSYPAGLYGDEDSLYVLMRDATGDAVVWDLHRIDPERDAVVGKLRLPTNAPHVSLLPGRRYWLLEESSSGFVNPLRPPVRLLLLNAAAIRAGEALSCD